MLSIFPTLLAYENIAPFLLRLTLGVIFIYWSYGKLKTRTNSKEVFWGSLELGIGVLFIVGFLTQLVASISALMLVFHLIEKIKQKALFSNGINYYFILFVISLSILITGAGSFAFDLPL
jgi:uncharacterized membrane protein YphA (DoxX/SURF4 family)